MKYDIIGKLKELYKGTEDERSAVKMVLAIDAILLIAVIGLNYCSPKCVNITTKEDSVINGQVPKEYQSAPARLESIATPEKYILPKEE